MNPSDQIDAWLLATRRPTTVSELVGPASIFSLVVGLIGATLSYCCYRWGEAWMKHLNVEDLFYYLPRVMVVLSFVQTLMVAQSYAYSGPIIQANVYREPGRYKLHFASQVAFAFGLVFAFNALRIKPLRRKVGTWGTIALYVAIAVIWGTGYMRRQ